MGLAATLTMLVACGGPDGSATSPDSPTAGATSQRATADPSESASTPAEDPSVPDPTGKHIVVTGAVAPGAEAGCLILATPQATYLLLGERANDLRPGSTVTVAGIVRTDLASTCQQGEPLQVTEVRRQ